MQQTVGCVLTAIPMIKCLLNVLYLLLQEFTLEKNMWKMKEEWEEVKLNTSVYRDSNVSILSSVDDIQTMLDDQIIKTQTMRGSHFIKPFEKEIKVNSTFLLLLFFLLCHM